MFPIPPPALVFPSANNENTPFKFNLLSLTPADEQKKFVLKPIFKDLEKNLKSNSSVDGPIETHYNIPWKVRLYRDARYLNIYLDCCKSSESENWAIDVQVNGKVISTNGDKQYLPNRAHFARGNNFIYYGNLDWVDIRNYVISGEFRCEISVEILKIAGIRADLRAFDDDEAKELSDVTLVVGNKKFYVIKMYLASHSTYFKSLLLGNFSESGKSEIELKEIDASDLQNFLELIYGEPVIDDETIDGILKLADMYDSKTAIRQCEKFLLNESKKPLKAKFTAAVQYRMEHLKTTCMSEMKTIEDLRSIVPEGNVQFDHDVWKELYMKLLALKI
ncbi:hypothetical protein B9Z55_007071 [Caenorhabditis nigoni]|uniref:BTB domain-containing protein n=1 Tax=Caenorhabditis nigoni TaxID=1611254 RepID=A0A2G5V827_9PELO|nr:hypothetical protein B9Z55_007071 [Caenorhabditis nigoni]